MHPTRPRPNDLHRTRLQSSSSIYRDHHVKLDELASRCGEWLRGSGPQSDIVMSRRIRLARNLADFPFIRRCNEQDRAGISKSIRGAMKKVSDWKESLYIDVAGLPDVDRQFLVERQLISR